MWQDALSAVCPAPVTLDLQRLPRLISVNDRWSGWTVFLICTHIGRTMEHMAKDERITVRVSQEQLDLFKEAAELEGRTLSDFTVSTLTSRSNDVLAEQRVFKLTGARWNELMSMLDQPPVIRPNLADALRMHAKRVKA